MTLAGTFGWRSAAAALAGMCLCAVAGAEVIYVRAGTTGANNGTSWTDAHPDLQSALSRAMHGDEIWVAAALYRPAPTPGDRNIAFRLVSGVAVFGGFGGVETERSQRDWLTNETVLSGDLAGDDGPDFAATTENSYQVVVAVDCEHGTALDGFTITGGRADGPSLGPTPASKDQGSGLNIYEGSLMVEHCTFAANWSGNHGAINDHSHGGMVRECVFAGNFSAAHGAGLYIHDHTPTSVQTCMFINNRATTDGGGLYIKSTMGVPVTDCCFALNHADRGAGAYTAIGAAATFSACLYRDNVAGTGGGGLYNDRNDSSAIDCDFLANDAGLDITGGGGGGGGSGGGGIWSTGGAPTIENCTFTSNRASFGGGVYFIDGSTGRVGNCTFTLNRASEAGGLYTLSSDVTVHDCLFDRNNVEDGAFPVGGGVSNYFSDSRVERCTFIANSAQLGGGGVYNEGEDPQIIACSFIGNRTTGFDGEGTPGWGGAIMNGYFTRATIASCTMVGNSASVGGGIYSFAFAEPSITNCTIIRNDAGEAGGVFGHPFVGPSELHNSIIRANQDAQIVGPLAAASYNCVQGGSPGPGSIDADPLFIATPDPGPDGQWGTDDDLAGDLRLSSGSPCIDSGDSFRVPAAALTDAAGLPRITDDPGAPDSGLGFPTVDMGAHERQPDPCRADFDGDGFVTGLDFDAFVAAFEAGEPSADFDSDGFITGLDFDAYIAAFEAGC